MYAFFFSVFEKHISHDKNSVFPNGQERKRQGMWPFSVFLTLESTHHSCWRRFVFPRDEEEQLCYSVPNFASFLNFKQHTFGRLLFGLLHISLLLGQLAFRLNILCFAYSSLLRCRFYEIKFVIQGGFLLWEW